MNEIATTKVAPFASIVNFRFSCITNAFVSTRGHLFRTILQNGRSTTGNKARCSLLARVCTLLGKRAAPRDPKGRPSISPEFTLHFTLLIPPWYNYNQRATPFTPPSWKVRSIGYLARVSFTLMSGDRLDGHVALPFASHSSSSWLILYFPLRLLHFLLGF